MRPGQVRPGIPPGHRDRVGRVHGFNEAGAGSPRNTAGASFRPGGSSGEASMRPGQVRPGILGSRGLPLRHDLRFNEAGAGSPRNTTPAAGRIHRRL